MLAGSGDKTTVGRRPYGSGGAACIPAFPRDGLSECLIDPAIAWLAARGTDVLFGRRVTELRTACNRVTAIATVDGSTTPDAVALAVPPATAPALPPGRSAPCRRSRGRAVPS